MSVKLDDYDLSRHVIILTGATDGIGKETARTLSRFNPKRLILPVRNIEKGNNLLEYIKSSNEQANNVEIWEMDLADLQSVKNFSNKFINEVGELHMIINNAGILVDKQIIKTKDDLELQFQVNHLAPFLLTNLLLDTMKKSVSAELPGRISFVSSIAERSGKIDFDNLSYEKGVSGRYQAYSDTKLMNIIVSNELGRMVQNDNITTVSVHPGSVKSNLGHLNSGIIYSLLIFAVGLIGVTPEKAAVNVLYPTLSKSEETGKYYNNCVEEVPNKLANDEEIAKKLWNASEQILRDHGMI